MTTFLLILACCTFGAFMLSWTDTPTRRTTLHTIRSAALLVGFVGMGMPLMILGSVPHPLATPLSYVAFVSWTALGALWSMRLDPQASKRPLPAWMIKPWSPVDTALLGAMGISSAIPLLPSATLA